MKEKTIDFVLRATWMSVQKMYHEEAKKKGSTMATGFALISIDPDKGSSSTALGPKMGIEATSLSRTLNSMEEKGLIRKVQDEVDRRQVLVYLTEEGYKKRKQTKETIKTFNKLIESEIPQKEIEVFFKVLDQVNKIAENNHLSTE